MKKIKWLSFIFITVFFCSCYSVRIQTVAQEGTEMDTVKVNSFFWGLAQSPKQLTTPNCDSLKRLGMSQVSVKSNFGNTMISILTLGIWHPLQVFYKCSKPCQKIGDL